MKKGTKKKAASKKAGRKFSQTDAVESVLKRIGPKGPAAITEAVIKKHADTFSGTTNPGASIRALLQRSPRFRSVEGGWEVVPQDERPVREAAAPKAEKPARAKRAAKKADAPAETPAKKRGGGRKKKAAAEAPVAETGTEEPAAPKKRRTRKAKAAAAGAEATQETPADETAETTELEVVADEEAGEITDTI